jgi:signal recognition particle subunit SRP54
MQRALLGSDVNVKQVFELTKKIKERSLNEKPPSGMTPREHVVKIVYEELIKFVGNKVEISTMPKRMLFVGLFGSGKTTSIGKVARFYQKKGLKPALIGCDVHRPAAMEQLKQIAKQINVPVYAPENEKDAVKIAKTGIEMFDKKNDLLIFDSSGRDSLDQELAHELKKMGDLIKPDEVLLTIPADLGQAAGPQAAGFSKLVGITGVFLSKMDATARGGGAITACSITGAPVKFIGVGEKVDAIEIFDPERFISRLIGFGDLQSLLEKAKEIEFKPETAQKMMSGQFTMNEFYEQLQSMGKMGSLKSVLDSIPGLGMKMPKEFDVAKQEGKMKKWKVIIEGMTKQERENPELINPSRVKRIAKGSGVEESEVRELLKNHEKMKKMMKMMSGGGMKRGMMGKLAKGFKGLM